MSQHQGCVISRACAQIPVKYKKTLEIVRVLIRAILHMIFMIAVVRFGISRRG
jgi:hypothetical protein